MKESSKEALQLKDAISQDKSPDKLMLRWSRAAGPFDAGGEDGVKAVRACGEADQIAGKEMSLILPEKAVMSCWSTLGHSPIHGGLAGKGGVVVFLRGCPLRSPLHIMPFRPASEIEFHALASRIVCRTKGLHTPAIKLRANLRQISLEDASIRAASRPFVEAFVLSGGEPLQQLKACHRLFGLARSLELACGLETSGFYPDRLRRLLEADVVTKSRTWKTELG